MTNRHGGGLTPPTRYLIRAALHVASLLDDTGSRVSEAHESYWVHATGGVFPPPDLQAGERLLVASGLVKERDAALFPTRELLDLLSGTIDDAVVAIAARLMTAATARANRPLVLDADESIVALVPDPQRREELLTALARHWDDSLRREIGAIGEEIVTATARDELASLGHPELSRHVRRVSLESDQLGYDISAPRTSGPPRLLEVKATATQLADFVVIHLTRHEFETGRRYPDDWALVICSVTDVANRSGHVLGWCPAQTLERAVPADSSAGRWESAELRLALDHLDQNLPRPAP